MFHSFSANIVASSLPSLLPLPVIKTVFIKKDVPASFFQEVGNIWFKNTDRVRLLQFSSGIREFVPVS